MKPLFFASLLFLSLYSCKQDKINSTRDILAALSPQKQVHNIDPTQDNLIEGDKGTKIFISANSFVFKDGSIPEGRITISVKEFYSVSNFVSNSLSSVSDSFLLETAGMIHIAAFENERDLLIDKNKSIVLAFPTKDTAKPMNVFYGDTSINGQINWQPGFWASEGGIDNNLVDSSLYENKITVCTYVSDINQERINWKLNHPDSSIFNYVYKNFSAVDSALVNELCVKGIRPEMWVVLDKTGKIKEIDFDLGKINYDKAPLSIRKTIADFFKGLPPFDLKSMGETATIGSFYLGLCCHPTFNREKYNEKFNEKYSKFRDQAIDQINLADLKYYILSASELGWINCDRFVDEDKEKIDFIVTSNETPDMYVYLAFDEFNSIMKGEQKGDQTIFNNVPLNSKVRVIGISHADGKPLMSLQHTTITKKPFLLSGFNSFTLNELEKQLNKL